MRTTMPYVVARILIGLAIWFAVGSPLQYINRACFFIDLSKIDHALTTENRHTRTMAKPSKRLSKEEFASLLTVGNTCAVLEPPAAIPAEHRARLIELGYMAYLSGRLRMTTIGRRRLNSAAN